MTTATKANDEDEDGDDCDEADDGDEAENDDEENEDEYEEERMKITKTQMATTNTPMKTPN